MKHTKIKTKCVGGWGGTNLLYLLCLISNTMPQLEQSSLQPSTYLQHRHLLQTTSYNHLLRLHLLISRKRKHKQQQARTPPPPPPPLDGGLRGQKGLRPFNPLQRIRRKMDEANSDIAGTQQRMITENKRNINEALANNLPAYGQPGKGEYRHRGNAKVGEQGKHH